MSQGRSVGGSSFREPIKRRQLAAYRVTVRWFMRALIPLLYVLGALSAFSESVTLLNGEMHVGELALADRVYAEDLIIFRHIVFSSRGTLGGRS